MKELPKGFTLVEIMIVVVIVGLLAAMAVPAFQKVRNNSIAKTIVNDGRQIGTSAQQYFMDKGVSSVSVTVDSESGLITGPLTEYLSLISNKLAYSDPGSGIEASLVATDGAFVLSHPLGDVVFNAEGKPVEASGDLAPNLNTID